jgi:hypothetical protein
MLNCACFQAFKHPKIIIYLSSEWRLLYDIQHDNNWCRPVTIPIMTQRFREIGQIFESNFFRQHKLAFSKDWVSLSFLQEKNNYLFLKTTRTTMTCLASCTIRFAVPTQAKNQDKRENQICMFRINFDRRFQTLYRLNYLILNPPSASIYSIRFFHFSQVCWLKIVSKIS